MNHFYPVYGPLHVPGAGMQAVHKADRPLCAYTAAAAWWAAGNPLYGPAAAMSEDAIEAAFANVARDHAVPQERFERWVRGLLGERVPALERAPEINGITPSPYQIDAVNSLTVAGGLLAFDVGLGKTITAAMAAWHYRANGVGDRCWIICPLIAMGAWKPYVPFLRQHFNEVAVMSVDSAHKLLGVPSAPGGVLIIDEIHTIGDTTARRTKSVHAIRPAFDVCVGLTGTMLHAGIEKVLSMLDAVVPGGMRFANKWKAGEHFKCLVKKRLGPRTVTALANPSGDARERFFEYLSLLATCVGRDNPDVRAAFELPPQELRTVEVCQPWRSLTTEVAEAVDAILAEAPFAGVPPAAQIMHHLSRAGVERKLEAFADLVAEHRDEPWVVFAAYIPTLDAVEAWLRSRGYSYGRIDGRTPTEERQRIQREFQAGGLQFVVGQITAAGQSIDLYRARLSVCFDCGWRAVDYAQALGRTHRRGQTRECIHYDLVANALQDRIVTKLRASQDFNAQAAEWQLAASVAALHRE